MFKWPIGRAGRGAILLWLVTGSIGFGALKFLLFHRLDLMIDLGFRFEAMRDAGHLPIWYVLLELLFDLGLAAAAIARLHDIGKPGWWLASIVAATALGAVPGAAILAWLGLAAWLALLFWPGMWGPNRFGEDPRGWKSREHYQAQMRMLAEETRPGKR